MLASVLDELEQISQRLDPIALDGRRAAALFEDAAHAERLCTSIKSRLARRVEDTKVWRESGSRSAAHWVAEATGETVGTASRTLETARALDALPETDAAFRAGRLSETQAAEVAGAAAAGPRTEAELLEAAGATSVKGLRDRCRQVRAGAEADDRASARRLHVNRRAHEWTDPDGMYRLEACLAPTPARGSAPRGRRTATASSVMPAAPGAVSRGLRTRRTRWWRWRARGPASRLRSGDGRQLGVGAGAHRVG